MKISKKNGGFGYFFTRACLKNKLYIVKALNASNKQKITFLGHRKNLFFKLILKQKQIACIIVKQTAGQLAFSRRTISFLKFDLDATT
ncbi:hypothetical protein [Methanosarcina sp.]|uniref:hypothetical protein n=1 Tax=Methanosarcina sp. TaxID=2213 RepID=UPI003C7183D7